jgi:hypothetical protein
MGDGRIIIGECKTRELKPKDATKYEKLAAVLSRRPNAIIFATSVDDISRPFQATVDALVGASILTPKELLN